jgi:hypothetical protein
LPITWTIDDGYGIVRQSWVGCVTAEELGVFFRAISSDPRALALGKALVDLRSFTPGFSGRELKNLIDTVVRPAVYPGRFISAIVVAEPVQVGLSRQYQVFSEAYSADQIFTDYDEALAWLMQHQIAGV